MYLPEAHVHTVEVKIKFPFRIRRTLVVLSAGKLNRLKGGRTSHPRTFFSVAKVFYLPICSATLQTKASQLQTTTTAAHYRKMKPQDLN